MWTILRDKCSGIGTEMQRTALLVQFCNATPKPGAPISEYFSKLTAIRNQLVGTPQAITEGYFKVQIYKSMPPEFKTTVIYQQNLPDNTPVATIMENLVRDELMRTISVTPAASAEALYSNSNHDSNRGRERTDRWCDNCKRNTHNTRDCWNLNNSKGKRTLEGDEDKSESTNNKSCWHCGEAGHISRNCPARQKGEAAKRQFKKRKTTTQEQSQSNTAEANLALGTRPARDEKGL
jgi:hypothetical protein